MIFKYSYLKFTAFIFFYGTISLLILNSCDWRNPVSIARGVSGFSNISKNSKVLHFSEEWSGNGDGYVLVVLKLSDLELGNLILESKKENYKRLPLTEGSFPLLDKYLFKNDRGFYKYSIKRESEGCELAIINEDKRTLIVFVLVT